MSVDSVFQPVSIDEKTTTVNNRPVMSISWIIPGKYDSGSNLYTTCFSASCPSSYIPCRV